MRRTEPTTTEPAAAATRRRAEFHPLRVAAVDRLTEDAVAVTFDVPPDLAEAYDFAAGQHITVRHRVGGEEIRRNYSICSPAGSGSLRIAVRRLADGAFSAYATEDLRPGDVLEVMTPTGRFTLRPDAGARRHIVAVAAGSGITPVLSILSTLLEREPQSRCTLLYGNRTAGSIMFLEELEDLKDRYTGRFLFLNVLSREPAGADLLSGRIDAGKLTRFLDTLLSPEDVDEWFLCGPLGMIEDASRTLLARGVEPRRVHTELFHAEGEPPQPTVRRGDRTRPGEGAGAGASRVTVILDGRTSTFDAGDAEPILDATLRVRGDAPYACKGGVCGTCRAKLVSGEVEMDRNHALEPDEVAAGFVLACQSHPVTGEVALDFDQ